jgi:protein-tyrosine phosphatase
MAAYAAEVIWYTLMEIERPFRMNRILFLCSGNYYRSRFAEILFNHHARQRGLKWAADSRGLAIDPMNCGPISRYTKSCLTARGILCETFERLPLPAAEVDFAASQRVIAVKEAEHRSLVEAKFSIWRDRVEYWHIHDVDCATPDEAIPLLEREVLNLLDRLATAAA